jgi:hypothetical protein
MRNIEEARKKFGALTDIASGSLMEDDPLAQAVIESLEGLTREQSIGMIEQAITRGVKSLDKPPKAFLDLFDQVQSVPDWVDWRRIEIGQKAMVRPGDDAGLVLSSASLMADYWSAAAVKPLTITGRLIQDTARRLLQTMSWWVEVHTPGGMHHEHEGYMSTIRVRLVHARVRHMLQKSNLWNAQAWGLPINQTDLLFQVSGFTYVIIDAYRKIGYNITDEEIEGIYALWRYTGHVLGVKPENLKFINAIDMKAFYDLWVLTNPPPEEECKQLAYANLNEAMGTSLFQRFMANTFLRPLLSMYARNFLGDHMCNSLDIGGRSIKWVLPVFIRPWVRMKERRIKGDEDKYNEMVEAGLKECVSAVTGGGMKLRGRTVSAPEKLSPVGRLKSEQMPNS